MSRGLPYLLPLIVCLTFILAGCEPRTTNEKPASEADAKTLAAPRTQAARQASPHDSASSTAVTGAKQVTTIRLPAAPQFEVPHLTLPDTIAAQRINKALIRFLLTTNLEDSTHLATAAQAIRRAKAEYNANGQVGVFGTSFKVLYNKSNLLSLELTTEYSSAYPSSATRHATFDLHTGNQVKLTDLLADTSALRKQWHARINKRLAAYYQEVAHYHADTEDAWATVREYTGWSDTLRQVRPAARPPLREFALTARGLVLYTSFEFPHVALDLAPPDDYLFLFASIRPWVVSQSLLGEVYAKGVR